MRKFRKKIIISAIIILSLIVLTVVHFNLNVNPKIITASTAKLESLANKAAAEAVKEISSQNVYTDFVSTVYNSQGDIQLIQANTPKILAASNEIALKIYDKLKAQGEQGIEIAIGTLSGLPILTEKGPKMNFEFLPIGNVGCEINSTFTSCGINQTFHRIYAIITCEVTVIVPGFRNQKVTVRSTALLAESIIVGKVPEVYLSGGLMHSSLNLVP